MSHQKTPKKIKIKFTNLSAYNSVLDESKPPEIKRFSINNNEFYNRNSLYFRQCKLRKAPASNGDQDDMQGIPFEDAISREEISSKFVALDELLLNTQKIMEGTLIQRNHSSCSLSHRFNNRSSFFNEPIQYTPGIAKRHKSVCMKHLGRLTVSEAISNKVPLAASINTALLILTNKTPSTVRISESNLCKVRTSLCSLGKKA